MARRGGGAGAPGGGGAVGAPGSDVQYILAVFRACRLCGAGGGYKMPICGAPGAGVDLPAKIRDLTHIEVSQNDKMPPLICELCVDKVNDLYEFVEMCRQTNARTRERLGLPPQALPPGAMDAGDCILGVTEPVFVNEDSNDGEPLARQKNRIVLGQKGKRGPATPPPTRAARRPSPAPAPSGARHSKMGLKELRVNMNGRHRARESAHPGRRAPSPAPAARPSRRDAGRDSLARVKCERDSERAVAARAGRDARHKGILKVPKREEDDRSLLQVQTRLLGKRGRGAEEARGGGGGGGGGKRVKLVARAAAPERRAEKRRAPSPRPPPRADAKRRPGPASARAAGVAAHAAAAHPHRCAVCGARFAKLPSLQQHLRGAHPVAFTMDKLACNPCGEWFPSAEEAGAHHRWHKAAPAPYVCRLCTAEFRQLHSYNKHFAAKMCVPSTEVPDVQCAECWQHFPGEGLLRRHACPGEDGRPGGKCAKCRKQYARYRTLRRHEEGCLKATGKRSEPAATVSPELLRRVRPAQVRVARCDPLLERGGSRRGARRCDVSGVPPVYGLDKNCIYPYISSVRFIKREPDDYCLSSVKDEIKDEPLDYEDTSFADYESYSSSDEDATGPNMVPNPFAKKKTIDRLSIMSLRTIFSTKFLGPKTIQKKRKRRIIIKPESIKSERNDVFDSLFNNTVDKDKEVSRDVVDLSDDAADKAAVETAAGVIDTTREESDVTVVGGEETADTDIKDPTVPDHGGAVNGLVKENGMNKEVQDEPAKEESEKDTQPIENPFDDEAMDQDVSSAVDDLIAGLNKSEENESKQGTDTKVSKIEDKSVTQINDESVPKIDKQIETNHNDTRIDQDDQKNSDPVKSIDKEKDDLDAAINVFCEEGNMNDDDFDVNSMFSGDLGPANINSKPMLVVNEKKPSEVTENEVEEKRSRNIEEDPKEKESLQIDIRIGAERADDKSKKQSSVETKTDVKAVNNAVSSVSDEQCSVINAVDTGGGKAVIDAELEERTSQEENALENNENSCDNTTMDDVALMAALDAQIGEDKDFSKSDCPKASETDSKQSMASEHENERSDAGQIEEQSAEKSPEKPGDRGVGESNNLDAEKPTKVDVIKDSAADEGTPEPEEKISLDELLMSSKEATPRVDDENVRGPMDLDAISDEEFNFDT